MSDSQSRSSPSLGGEKHCIDLETSFDRLGNPLHRYLAKKWYQLSLYSGAYTMIGLEKHSYNVAMILLFIAFFFAFLKFVFLS